MHNPSTSQGSSARVASALAAKGVRLEIREFPASTRTAADAAAAIGCDIAQIAKSIILRSTLSNRVVLVITSGTNRVDEAKVSQHVGEPLTKADAEFVRNKTGFSIGGVAPVGHLEPPIVLMDADLLQYDSVWAAAGTPNSVFCITPQQMTVVVDGLAIVDIKQENQA